MEFREPLKTGAMLASEYRIDQVLGAGGFGITYLAEDVRLHMPVAIKEYFPADFALRDATHSVRARSGELGDTFRWGLDSFLREAQMLARFDHPAITRVLRVIEANNTAYLVLRYEEGLPLRQHLQNLGRFMTEAEIRRMLYPILDALELVHARSILHRDISPDNVIVRPDGLGVLIDFGAARTAIADKSQALTGIVREGYSPPEQFGSGGRQGPWTDLYAMGSVLYQIVTGVKPATSVHRMLEDPVVPAVEAAAGRYGDRLLHTIDQCMKLKHAERPQTINDFRRLLTGHAAPSGPAPVVLSPGSVGPAVPPPPPGVTPAPGPAAAASPIAPPPRPVPVPARGPAVVEPPPSPRPVAAGPLPPVAPRVEAGLAPPQPAAAVGSLPYVAPKPLRMPLSKLLFSFSGRINRAKLWLGFLMLLIVLVLGLVAVVGLAVASGEIDKPNPGPVTIASFIVLMIVTYWICFAIYVKRAHDRGWSGWFSLLILVPLIGFWPMIEFLFLIGDAGENRFGPDPLGRSAVPPAQTPGYPA